MDEFRVATDRGELVDDRLQGGEPRVVGEQTVGGQIFAIAEEQEQRRGRPAGAVLAGRAEKQRQRWSSALAR